jgi:hypothetical protein
MKRVRLASATRAGEGRHIGSDMGMAATRLWPAVYNDW